MSKEREVIEVKSEGNEKVPPTLTRAERKARFAQVLDRSIVGDRLKVNLPPNVYGEWVPNDQMEIYRMEALGFKIDTEFARQRELHSRGDAASYVGDCVFMVQPMEDHEILEEIRKEQYDRLNSKKPRQREEKDFATQVSKELQEVGIVPTTESTVNEARKSDLEAALGVTKD